MGPRTSTFWPLTNAFTLSAWWVDRGTEEEAFLSNCRTSTNASAQDCGTMHDIALLSFPLFRLFLWASFSRFVPLWFKV